MSSAGPTAFIRAKEQDEYYTPRLLTEVIVPYVPPGAVCWCPMDTKDSEFVHSLSRDHEVIYSHIWMGQNFFEYEPKHWDVVVSNPPFTLKLEVMKRLYRFGKPFALLLPMTMLNYNEINHLFLNQQIQLLIVDKRVSFNGSGAPPFNSSYFCSGLLPKDLLFQHLPHNNTGKNFVPSRMLTSGAHKNIEGYLF